MISPFNAELNPMCHFLVLLAHHILHVSRVRVKGQITVKETWSCMEQFEI